MSRDDEREFLIAARDIVEEITGHRTALRRSQQPARYDVGQRA
jgi:hypothetical protein